MLERNGIAGSAESVSALPREVIDEFGRHLDMLAEQLGASLAEADRECMSVGESFHELSAAKGAIAQIECDEPSRSTLQHSCRKIDESLRKAVISLQYQDRLAQRLALVRASLVRLQTLLHDQSNRSHIAWLRALGDVERTHRLEQKRLSPARLPEDETGPEAAAPSSVELF